MRHLIISDIHERPRRVQAIIVHALKEFEDEPPTHGIFLGDWWDTREQHMVEETNDLLLKTLDGDDVDPILGNHDAGYFFGDGRFGCTGWSAITQRLIDQNIMLDVRRKFKLASIIKIAKDAPENADRLVICSHAGLHPDLWTRAGSLSAFEQECETALDLAFNGDFHRYFDVGGVRGGWAKHGGLTWLDWQHEFKPIGGMIQIVGHTLDRETPPKVRIKPFELTPNFCLDTGLQHYMVVDDVTGKIHIKEVPS